MKFSTRVLLGLLATNQLVTAAPIGKALVGDTGKLVSSACVVIGVTCSQFPGPLPKTVGGAITDVGVTGALIAQASEHPGVQHAAKKVEKGVKAAENAAVDGACKLGEACLGAAQAITNAASGAIRGGKKKPQDIEMGQVGGNGRRRALQETPLYARVRSHDGLQDL